MPAATDWPESEEERWSTSSQPEAKRPRRSYGSWESGLSLTSTTSVETTWTVSDIAKAGCLLTCPPRQVSFDDEEEMRRVYSLIYDVFRYKSVLHQAMDGAAFFLYYPQFKKQANLVWLLFYDLYKRRFLPRDNQDEEQRIKVFENAGLLETDKQLWKVRVKLAASVARLRIKNNALKLSQLLPPHLRDERVVALDDAPVTGWINTFKIDTGEVTTLLEKAGLKVRNSKFEKLDVMNYETDDICPKFIQCHSSQRADIAQSTLVRQHHFVLQDRAFCLGPAFMSRILRDLDLSGNVIQSHINSPRTMAYLANILADNGKIELLIAFGAGERKTEYEEYLKNLGVTNTEVHAEKFVDVPNDSEVMDRVVGILATPPNTYSGVIDPVDLVCSRGGDLNMLEVLTETEIGGGSRDRINSIMEEQRQTLRMSMSRPQIQVVLYETHSIVQGENSELVTRLVEEMNNNAREKHAEELCKAATSPSYTSITSRKEGSEIPGVGEGGTLRPGGTISFENADSKDSARLGSAESDVPVPPCDIFEMSQLPDLSLCRDESFNVEEEGCYFAYLHRKEIVRLNAKYMINIAETRGLFGGGESGKDKKSPSGRQRKKPDLQRTASGNPAMMKPKGRTCKIEIDRIAAPTQASIRRSIDTGKRSSTGESQDTSSASTASYCQRHHTHMQQESSTFAGISPKLAAQVKRQDARRWWAETARHVMLFGLNQQFGLETEQQNQVVVTETEHRPLLKLTRSRPNGRLPLPINVTSIEFEDFHECLPPVPQCTMV